MASRQEHCGRWGSPRTSVLMPAFNADETLVESIESVLAQRLADLELIVIDDASDRPVADVLAGIGDERLRVVRRRRNGGIARARNTGLRLARAPYVSQLDADDLWEPDYLESVLPRFADPRVGMVYSNATIIGHPDGLTDYIRDAAIHPRDGFPELAEANPAPCPTVTVRAEAMRSVGGYGGWLRAVEDWHLYMRLAAVGWRFDYVDRPLAHYRWPRPQRGLSFDSSRMERWSRLALAHVSVRHPRTPGPKRQLWKRLRRGFDHGAR